MEFGDSLHVIYNMNIQPPIKKQCFHRLVKPDGTELRMVVVETDSDGRFLGFHHLQEEEPFVEWCGGTYRLPVF